MSRFEVQGADFRQDPGTVSDVVRQVEEEATVERKAILRKSPHYAPLVEKRSPIPLFHAASREARKRFREAFKDFLEACTEASARLHEGHLDIVFPSNCFPPGLPFTGTRLSRAGPSTEATAALP